jgi:hypothetical protein
VYILLTDDASWQMRLVSIIPLQNLVTWIRRAFSSEASESEKQ